MPSPPPLFGITSGPDGNLWFTEHGHIARITTAGVISEFAIPSQVLAGYRMAPGPDGNVWFPTSEGVARVTPAGVVTQFEISGAAFGIANGPDANLWVTDYVLGGVGQTPPIVGVGRFTPAGNFTQFEAENDEDDDITAGRDGAVWFTLRVRDKIGRITTNGVVTYFEAARGSRPGGITAAADGSIWFCESDLDRLARRDPSGSTTEWQLRSGSSPIWLTAGPDQKMWFSAKGAIGSISADGDVTEIPLPHPYEINLITAGPDGNLWFTDVQNGAIGRLDVSSIEPIPNVPTLSAIALYLLAAAICAVAVFTIPLAR